MIELIEGYYIEGKAYDYALMKRTGGINKHGEEVSKTIGYYGKVDSCIKACYKDMCLEVTQTKKMTLPEALKEFKRLETNLVNAIPKEFK